MLISTTFPIFHLLGLYVAISIKFELTCAIKGVNASIKIGASVVNALSNWLEVEIFHDGKIYQQRYERGKVMEKLAVIGECEEGKSGTKVTFLPDDTIFETTIFDFNVLKQRFREMAFLTKGL